MTLIMDRSSLALAKPRLISASWACEMKNDWDGSNNRSAHIRDDRPRVRETHYPQQTVTSIRQFPDGKEKRACRDFITRYFRSSARRNLVRNPVEFGFCDRPLRKSEISTILGYAHGVSSSKLRFRETTNESTRDFTLDVIIDTSSSSAIDYIAKRKKGKGPRRTIVSSKISSMQERSRVHRQIRVLSLERVAFNEIRASGVSIVSKNTSTIASTESIRAAFQQDSRESMRIFAR